MPPTRLRTFELDDGEKQLERDGKPGPAGRKKGRSKSQKEEQHSNDYFVLRNELQQKNKTKKKQKMAD